MINYSFLVTKKNLNMNRNVDVELYINIISKIDIKDPIIGFVIKDSHGNLVTGGNTIIAKSNLQEIPAATNKKYLFKFVLPNFKSGYYFISPAIAMGTQKNHIQLDWVNDAEIIKIDSKFEDCYLGWQVCLDKIEVEEI